MLLGKNEKLSLLAAPEVLMWSKLPSDYLLYNDFLPN